MPEPTMRFVDPRDDPWQTLGADDPAGAPAPRPFALLTLAQWQAAAPNWPKDFAVGVAIGNDVDPETLVDSLPRLGLIALDFPTWTDGRAYSQARLLRVRHRFTGELRATGVVLADMMPLLLRCGFDAAALRADQSVAVARRALGFFPDGHYQGDTVEPRPLFARMEAR